MADPGPGVDAHGQPVVDPTDNVRQLTEAAVQRLDDLREAEGRRQDAEIRHVTEMATLRAAYEDRLHVAESARIDAIRSVDVAAVQATAALATATAETLRLQVATTAAAFDVKLATALDPLTKDIVDLRRSQWEGVGGRAESTERRLSTGATLAIVAGIVGVLGLMLTVAALAVTIILATR
jgi:hypothetical protein